MQLQDLARFAPIFSASTFKFAECQDPPPGISGDTDRLRTPDAAKFVRAARDPGWLISFDWFGWTKTQEGKDLTERPDRIASASQDELAKALTALMRDDRFHQGRLEGAFESGVLTAIVQRAESLLHE